MTGVTPADDAVNVDENTSVVVQFSEPVQTETVTAGTITLNNGTANIPVNFSFTGGNSIITMIPVTQPLPLYTTFTLTVGTSILDTAGNPLEAGFISSFTTRSPDVTGPTVAGVVPADGADEVSISTYIQVTFNELIDTATVTATSFSINDGSADVVGSFSFLNNNTIVRFIPDEPLPFDTLMTVELTGDITDVVGNALTDGNGDPLTQPLTFMFTTGSFAISNPADGSDVIETSSILIEASGSASLNIDSVIFTVNGEEFDPISGPLFVLDYMTPEAAVTSTLTINALARNSSGTEIVQDQVTVNVVVGLRIAPNLQGIPLGETGNLILSLSSAIGTDLTVDLSAMDPAMATLPDSVVLIAGQTEKSVQVDGAGIGATTILASSNRGMAAAIVSVSEPVAQQQMIVFSQAVGVFVPPSPSAGYVIVPEGSQQTFSVRLLFSPAGADTSVTVTSSNSAVANVNTAVVIPAGGQDAAVTLDTGQAGEATLLFDAGNETRWMTVIVGLPSADKIPPTSALPVGVFVMGPYPAGQVIIEESSQQTFSVRLLFSPATVDTPVAVASSNSAVADIVDPVIILLGSEEAY